MARTGRPRIRLNKVQEKMLQQLASRFVTEADIAELISGLPDETGVPGPRIAERTLRRSYGRLLNKGHAEGRSGLAAAQWSKALAGNVIAQIWLGKQHLGQRDTPPPEPPRRFSDAEEAVWRVRLERLSVDQLEALDKLLAAAEGQEVMIEEPPMGLLGDGDGRAR